MSEIKENPEMALLLEHDSLIGAHNELRARGFNLKQSWKDRLDTACVIRGQGVETTLRRLEGLSVELFESFESLREAVVTNRGEPFSVGNITAPGDRAVDWVNSVRLLNSNLSDSEVCRILNHMNIWNYAVTQGKPVIVLEPSRIINIKLEHHLPRGSIIDLSGLPLRQLNPNWHCMQGIYSYAVDQFSARKLFNYVMRQGLREPLDYLFRDDLFLIRLAKSNDPLEQG